MKEKIKQIYDSEFEDYFNSDVKNEEIKGLQIMAQFSDDITIVPEHDELCAYLGDDAWEKITEEAVREIFKLNWRWDDENEGFRKFV